MMEQVTLQEYMDIKQEIRNSMTKAVVSFVEIGYNLKRIRDGELYRQDGYKDIWEAAEAEFGLKRKQAWAFMNINDRYSVDGNSMELLPQYQGFSKSTLTEMLTLPEEDYELITKDTKIEDIRELKQAEKEYEQKEEQIEGQQSLIDNYNDVVPDQDKPEDTTLSDVLRELFRPKDMERYLNRLLNDEDIKIWTPDFYQNVEHTFSKMPYFIFFYEYSDGFKIKNIKTQQIEAHSYNDLWLFTLKAFMTEMNQKEEHGGEVWDIAFGDEWREQQRIEKEKEKRLREAEKKKKEKEKAESIDSIPAESDFKEAKKAPKTTEIRSKESGTELEQPKEETKTLENESEEIAEKPDFILTETDSEVDKKTENIESDIEAEDMPRATCEGSPLKSGNGENCKNCALNPVEDESMCDIAQNTIILPVLPGDHIFIIDKIGRDDDWNPIYKVFETTVYMYELKSRKTIEMKYNGPDYTEKNHTRSCSIPIDGTYQHILSDKRIFLTKEEAEKRCAELNGEA